jgi:phosphohistidine phosphatase SixA
MKISNKYNVFPSLFKSRRGKGVDDINKLERTLGNICSQGNSYRFQQVVNLLEKRYEKNPKSLEKYFFHKSDAVQMAAVMAHATIVGKLVKKLIDERNNRIKFEFAGRHYTCSPETTNFLNNIYWKSKTLYK